MMERNGDVTKCVLAIETCTDVSEANILGDYEILRREKLQKDGVGFVERIILESNKMVVRENTSVIEGKGGGERKQKFELTCNNLLYAALAITTAFVVWASTGGLSLH